MPTSSSPPPRSVNLALQGGGSHGAFTWGVLDALLADERLRIEGVSGTSAGAVNAVALAHGFARDKADGRRAARDALTHIWQEIMALGRLSTANENLTNLIWGVFPKEFAPTNFFSNALSSLVSPYQANPLDINPLRSLLEREIDFPAVSRLTSPKVFVSATRVATGKAEIFHGKRLTAQAVMASACLPMLYQAVEIDGEAYWDGGYSGNPALSPLINLCETRDLVLVQINPLRRDATPNNPHDIVDRVNELTFNASLLAQMRTIDFINRLLDDGRLGHGGPFKRVLLHRIDGGKALGELPASSKMSTDPTMIHKLFELGVASAQHWLKQHFDALGQASTVDIRRDYLDDMRMGGVNR